jgi:nucleoside-diphosphate-sugar epimerase
MSSIFITGSSGFVGLNLIEYLTSFFTFYKYQRETPIEIYQEVVIHLAGKAHDLKKTSNSNEYLQINTELTKKVFDAFLVSNAKVFITLSSVKAVADEVEGVLTEDYTPNPITNYGKSKLLAEQYILSKQIPEGKRVYILRPCMIHGPGNKGNLNLLYKLVSKGIPWPLGAFENKRSYCTIDNLCFVINELIDNDKIMSGIYNIADDSPLSTNQLINLIAISSNKKIKILKISQKIISELAKIGDMLTLPLNSETLKKLTENYIVSNQKIKNAIAKPFPVSTEEGLLKTLSCL